MARGQVDPRYERHDGHASRDVRSVWIGAPGPRPRGTHLRFFVAFVVALVIAGTLFAYELPLFLEPPLFISVGTLVNRSGARIGFTVEGGPRRLVGRWHATQGGFLWLNPPDSAGFRNMPCIAARDWNGTANVSLRPGRYSLLVSPNPPGPLVLTETIRIVYPGGRNATNHAFFASGCGG